MPSQNEFRWPLNLFDENNSMEGKKILPHANTNSLSDYVQDVALLDSLCSNPKLPHGGCS